MCPLNSMLKMEDLLIGFFLKFIVENLVCQNVCQLVEGLPEEEIRAAEERRAAAAEVGAVGAEAAAGVAEDAAGVAAACVGAAAEAEAAAAALALLAQPSQQQQLQDCQTVAEFEP